MSLAYSSIPAHTAVEERRKFSRTICSGTVAIHQYPSESDAPARVRCRDLSAMGIGISHCTPLPLRSVFAVTLTDPEPTVMLYVVVHCTANSKAGYDIGARLSQVLRQRDSVKEDRKALSPRGQFMRSLLMSLGRSKE